MITKIRLNTFETNSSSYHTLTVTKVKPIIKEDIIGDDLIIKTVRQGNCNRTWEFNTPITKLKSLLNFLSYRIEEQAEAMFEVTDSRYKKSKSHIEVRFNEVMQEDENWYITDEEGFYFSSLTAKERQEFFNKTSIVKALIKLIKNRLGKNLILKYDDINVFDSDCFDQDLTDLKKGYKKEDFNNKEFLYNLFEDIIFNDEIILEHECQTNEE